VVPSNGPSENVGTVSLVDVDDEQPDLERESGGLFG
jgi:hypothetical protein